MRTFKCKACGAKVQADIVDTCIIEDCPGTEFTIVIDAASVQIPLLEYVGLLRRMSGACSIVYYLRVFCGWPPSEIADLLGRSENAVRVLESRAKAEMKK